MKLFKKIFLPVIAAICAITACALAACGDSDPDANLTEDQYVVYVYLADGTTPAEGIEFELCFNVNSTSSTCASGTYKTDSNGRVLFDMTDFTYVGNPVVHIKFTYDYDTVDENGDNPKVYELPDGYGLPANGSTQVLNQGSYDDAWALTEQITTLTLTAA